jgi:5-methylcytosine-specific restriction endonuclease McrA
MKEWGGEMDTIVDTLIADHILAIALNGEEWDINNLQTLCVECNKIKTAEDMIKIAKLRDIEKKQSNGQTLLNNATTL